MSLILNGDTGISAVDGTASAPALVGNDTDTGVYFSAANTLDFATSGTRQASISSAGLFQFNSGYGSVATAYGCRAWVNFDGTTNTGGFCTIRASGNVTSVADNGTGNYTVNFTNALVDTNYVGVVTGGNGRNAGATNVYYGGASGAAPTTTAYRIGLLRGTTTEDATDVCVAVFR